jgi:hypothetical protein
LFAVAKGWNRGTRHTVKLVETVDIGMVGNVKLLNDKVEDGNTKSSRIEARAVRRSVDLLWMIWGRQQICDQYCSPATNCAYYTDRELAVRFQEVILARQPPPPRPAAF